MAKSSAPIERTKVAQVASEAGVSAPVVSAILNPSPKSSTRFSESTRIRVQKIADKLGYRANVHARSLLTGRHNAVGILVHNFGHLDHHQALASISQAAWGRGVAIHLVPLSDIDQTVGGMPKIFTEKFLVTLGQILTKKIHNLEPPL